jgi:CHAD domain-containing protein
VAPRPRSALGSPGPSRLRAALLRTLASLERRIGAGLSHPTLAPEEIHEIHRELRRLTSGLAVWGQLVVGRQAASVREATGRVRRLARLVGRARDRDVTGGLLTPSGRNPRGDGLEAWDQFLGRLREDTHTGRELLRAFLRSERQAGLFDRVRALLDVPPRADASRGLHRILAAERRLRQGKVRKAHRRARRDPTSERLHRLRIRIRQWRHLATLEASAQVPVSRPPPSWRSLQDRLGRLHDLDIALATIPKELHDATPARRLKNRRRELRTSVWLSLERMAARPERATARARRRSAR